MLANIARLATRVRQAAERYRFAGANPSFGGLAACAPPGPPLPSIVRFRFIACGVFVSGPLSLPSGTDWLRCDFWRRGWPDGTTLFAKPSGCFHVSARRVPRASVSATVCADLSGPWPSRAWPDVSSVSCLVSAAATSPRRGALSTNQSRRPVVAIARHVFPHGCAPFLPERIHQPASMAKALRVRPRGPVQLHLLLA
jgi:hypothetical protein